MSSLLSPAAKKALNQAENGKLDQSVGGRGYTIRVVEETRGGAVILKWPTGPGRYAREALAPIRGPDGEPLRERVEDVMALAAEASLRRLNGERPLPGGEDEESPFRVRELIDRFRAEELPSSERSERRRRAIERDLDCFESFLEHGGDLDLPVEDVDVPLLKRFWRERKDGEIDSYGEPVRDEDEQREVSRSTASGTLMTVKQLFNWGRKLRRGGEPMVTWNPVDVMDLPTNENPTRVVCSDEMYEEILEAAEDVEADYRTEKRRPPLREIWIVAGATGHRASAVLGLRWEDWLPDRGSHGALRWREATDKTSNEHVTPVLPVVAETLTAWRKEQLERGEGGPWIFPAPRADGPVGVDVAHGWVLDAEKEVRGHHKPYFGLHALRRRWATKRKGMPVQDVAELGGWEGTQVLREIYQTSDLETMERVLEEGERVRLQEV